LSTPEDAVPAPGVGMKIISDNFPDVFQLSGYFQPPAQVLPGVDFTYLIRAFDFAERPSSTIYC
jgi:hypothetical protein